MSAEQVDPFDEQTPPPRALHFHTTAELRERVRARGPRRWLLRRLWPAADYGVFGADKKAQKTWATADLAVSVASGTRWLDLVAVDFPGPVLMFVGEGGEGNTLRRLDAAAEARGIDLDTLPIVVCVRAPHLNNRAHLEEFAAQVETMRPVLVTLDPLYLAARGAELGDLYKMGALLEGPQRLCQEAGAALFVVTHFNRAVGRTGAARITGAGPAEWGRVLITAEVKSRMGDHRDGGTDVTTALEIIGGEIPDQYISVRRRIWSDDPDDLDSPLHMVTEAEWTDGPTSRAATTTESGPTLAPADQKILAALDDLARPVTVAEIRSWILAHHGKEPARETVTRSLNRLERDGVTAGVTDGKSQGAFASKLWSRPPCDPCDVTRDDHSVTCVTPPLGGHTVTSHGEVTPAVGHTVDPGYCPKCGQTGRHTSSCPIGKEESTP